MVDRKKRKDYVNPLFYLLNIKESSFSSYQALFQMKKKQVLISFIRNLFYFLHDAIHDDRLSDWLSAFTISLIAVTR